MTQRRPTESYLTSPYRRQVAVAVVVAVAGLAGAPASERLHGSGCAPPGRCCCRAPVETTLEAGPWMAKLTALCRWVCSVVKPAMFYEKVEAKVRYVRLH